MPINYLSQTENFGHDYYVNSPFTTGVSVADAGPPPDFAGISAGRAWLVSDISAVAQGTLQGNYEDVTADVAMDWTGSVFVRKTSTPTLQFPTFAWQSINGTTRVAEVSFDPFTGDLADAGEGGAPPDAKGVINFNSLWWRVWWRRQSAIGNTEIKWYTMPARSDELGGPYGSGGTGGVVIFGANLTPTSEVQPYVPNPSYTLGLGTNLVVIRKA